MGRDLDLQAEMLISFANKRGVAFKLGLIWNGHDMVDLGIGLARRVYTESDICSAEQYLLSG